MAYPQKQRVAAKVFTTPKGTQLPMLDMGGKDYLPVPSRAILFREQHPNGMILSEAVRIEPEYAVFKASIAIENPKTGAKEIVATGYAQVTKTDFYRFVERAETAAIGRALGYGGWGTLQCGDELDEGEQLADAPVEVIAKGNRSKAEVSPAVGAGNTGRASKELPVSPVAAPVNSAAAAPSSAKPGPAKAALVEKAKSRTDVNNLLSSVSRAIIAKKLYKLEEIKGYMQKQYGTDDKVKLDDNQATELLGYLDNVNTNGLSNGAMATA